jgi:diguanylate cyclase (GGDEF)-like protein
MLATIIEHCHSLRFKIAAALFLILTISIGVAMFGIWIYEREQFIDMINAEAIRSGRGIEKSLRASMRRNDKNIIRAEVMELAATYDPPSTISIIDRDGRVTVSSEPILRGQIFDRFTSPSCTGCHPGRDEIPQNDLFVIKGENGPLLRNVIKIKNRPECHRCHPPATATLGVLLYDVDLTPTYDRLQTVAFRMFLTGLATFLAIGLVLFLAINRLIEQPINKLMQGFTEVGRGNYAFWIYEESSSEFGFMAEQFNVMNQAIGRFINEIKAKNHETTLLYTIVQEVSETIELEKLQKIIINLVHDIFNAEQNGLVVPHPKEKECFEIIWRTGNEKRLAHLLYRPGADLSFPAVTAEELAEWRRDNYVAHRLKDDSQRLLIPLRYSQDALGLICIKKLVGQPFSRHELAIIPALARHAAISMANSHLYHLAITDGLTDLYSKRHLLNKLDMLAARASKYANESFFVMMIDIDYFKQVNDNYGHETGDQVLVQLAELLRKNLRLEDIAFRYGGEEFVVLVPSEPGEASLGTVIGERLRVAVEKHTFICHPAPAIRKTISVGVAHFPGHGKTSQDIIRAADAALYQAKHNGRNRVCDAAEATETGQGTPPA